MIQDILTQPLNRPSMPDDAPLYEAILQKAAAFARTFAFDAMYSTVIQGAMYDIAPKTLLGPKGVMETAGPMGYAWQIEVFTSSRFWSAEQRNHVNAVVPLCTITASSDIEQHVGMQFTSEFAGHVRGVNDAFDVLLGKKGMAA